MPFVDAKPVQNTKTKRQMVTVSITESKARGFVARFILSGDCLDKYFPECSEGSTFLVQFGTDEDKGLAMILPHNKGQIKMQKFGNSESHTLTCAAWKEEVLAREEAVIVPPSAEGNLFIQLP